MRSNLDPFNQYEDGDLWTALESVHLKQYVAAQDKKLEHPIAESTNFHYLESWNVLIHSWRRR